MSKKNTSLLDTLDLFEKKGARSDAAQLIPAQEALVLQGVMAGKKPAQAVQEAGYGFNKKNAKAFGEALVQKHTDCNGQLIASLANVGVNLDSLAQAVKEGMTATKPLLVAKEKDKDTGSETLHYADAPDHATRHKFVETVLDIMPGARAPKKVEVTQQTFEEKAVVVATVKENPQATLELMQRILDRKRTVTIEQ